MGDEPEPEAAVTGLHSSRELVDSIETEDEVVDLEGDVLEMLPEGHEHPDTSG